MLGVSSMVEVIKKKPTIMRIEKQILGMKRQLIGEAYGFIDKYLDFKETVERIAEEAGRPADEVWAWVKAQIEEEISIITPEEYAEDEDEEEDCVEEEDEEEDCVEEEEESE
jgi:hypothetical protein